MPDGGGSDFEDFRFLWSQATRRNELLSELMAFALRRLDSRSVAEVRQFLDQLVSQVQKDPKAGAWENALVLEFRTAVMRDLPPDPKAPSAESAPPDPYE